jgi:hypothetical protein
MVFILHVHKTRLQPSFDFLSMKFNSYLLTSALLFLHGNSCSSFRPSIANSHTTRIRHAQNMVFQVNRLLRYASAPITNIPRYRDFSSSIILYAKKKPGNDKPLRADRVLSNRGWGSRSECFDLLKQRRVFQKIDSEMQRVNGPSEKISMKV